MTPPPSAAVAAPAPAFDPRPRAKPQPRHRTPPAPVRRPRRISGPARPGPSRPRPASRTAPTPAQRRGRARAGAVAHAAHAGNPVSALIDHPLLDRVIHGRAWIGIVAFALIGIVTMQLGLLKLNAGIGRALEHEAALQRENSALSVENSELAAGDTIELQATHMGMQLIPAGTLTFLSARGAAGDVGRAVQALNARLDSSSSSTSSAGAETSAPGSESSPAGAASNESASPATGPSSGEPASEASAAGESQASVGESQAAAGDSPASTGESQG